MKKNYLFAHYLRGIAAVCVLFAHFTASFFISNEFISSVINIPKANVLSFPKIILDFMPVEFPGFLAVIGVAIFFLISGFLIPISIEKYSPMIFIKKRFLRLYPTYVIICFINILVAVVGFCIFYHHDKTYSYGIITVLSVFSMGLSQFIKGTVPIDPVAWTLAIEVVFYIATVLYFNLSFYFKKDKEIKILDVLLLSILLSVLVVILSKHVHDIELAFSILNVGFLIKCFYLASFMLIGTSFSLYAKNRINGIRLTYAVLFQYSMFVYITMKLDSSAFYISTVSTFSWFGLAILVFSLCYVMNDNLPEIKSLRFLGDVSYPLYLCHSYIGYFIIGMIINIELIPRSLTVFMPIPIVLIVAYIIHIKVENRFVGIK
ncbi:acyltransferase family protein [Kluyvera ascorbata]|uniref:acyltransferase family protein n=1 Tax=Kluyvera ascorbata TaxID=51288 RepID=UPI00356981C9